MKILENKPRILSDINYFDSILRKKKNILLIFATFRRR